MFNRGPTLTTTKELELEKALEQAQSQMLVQNFELKTTTHPITREFGLALQSISPDKAAPEINNANLVIVQHQDTGVIQFVFPVQSAQPLIQYMASINAHTYAFIRPLQLGSIQGDATKRGVANAAKWIVKAVLKVPEVLASDAILAAARVVESANKKEVFINLSDGYTYPASGADLNASQGRSVLLFVHGIFSSIHGGFSDLGDPKDKTTTMNKLVTKYGNRVFGYDHWTISKTPLQNAQDLLDAIPSGANWDIDVICHSRGGLVVRSLLSDIDGRSPLKNVDLKALAGKRQGKIRSVGKTFFVAAANQGSPLADPDEIRNFLNLAAFLASKTDCFALDVVIGLARILVSAAFNLPSIQELATTSTLVEDLNEIGTLMAADKIFGARADFDYAHSLLLEGGVILDKLLMRVDNDLVVPYSGVASPNPNILPTNLLEFGTPIDKQGNVWHTEFFGQSQTRRLLLNELV